MRECLIKMKYLQALNLRPIKYKIKHQKTTLIPNNLSQPERKTKVLKRTPRNHPKGLQYMEVNQVPKNCHSQGQGLMKSANTPHSMKKRLTIITNS